MNADQEFSTSSTTWSDSPLIEIRRLDELRNIAGADGQAFIKELKDAFEQDSALRVGKIREAIENEDAVALRDIAHTLKGSCTNVGASAMGELCLILEKCGGTGNMDEAGSLLTHLQRLFDKTIANFNEVLK